MAISSLMQTISIVAITQVLDHADRLHEVVMEPGDIVYYGEKTIDLSHNIPSFSGTQFFYAILYI